MRTAPPCSVMKNRPSAARCMAVGRFRPATNSVSVNPGEAAKRVRASSGSATGRCDPRGAAGRPRRAAPEAPGCGNNLYIS
jgi:hypothetical protein